MCVLVCTDRRGRCAVVMDDMICSIYPSIPPTNHPTNPKRRAKRGFAALSFLIISHLVFPYLQTSCRSVSPKRMNFTKSEPVPRRRRGLSSHHICIALYEVLSGMLEGRGDRLGMGVIGWDGVQK
jgi:hypothetical protein